MCNSRDLLPIHAISYDTYLRCRMLVLNNRGEEAAQEHASTFNAALARDAGKAKSLLEVYIRRRP